MTEPSEDELRATDWKLVVVGRGPAAVVNCVTRARVGTLPAKSLLVGRPDAWLEYADHEMGQYPSLLALPGFDATLMPRSAPKSFLSSRTFGESNRDQLHALLASHNIAVATADVEVPFEFVAQRWLVHLRSAASEITVTTENLDVCSGPGPGRAFSPGGGRVAGAWATGVRDVFDSSLLKDLLDRTRSRAFIAEDYMKEKSSAGSSLVVGEGPLAASCVEHALRRGAPKVIWVGRPLDMAQLSFPPSARYDNLVSDADDVRAWSESVETDIASGKQPNLNDLTASLRPRDARMTILLGQVSAVHSDHATIVPHGYYDMLELSAGDQIKHPSGSDLRADFAHLIVSAASENSEAERHAAAHLLRSLPKWATAKGLQPIESAPKFVGLETPDGSLRVLGAASRNTTLLNDRIRSSTRESEFRAWHDSLCAQARMPRYAMSIAVSGATIAAANAFYAHSTPDRCAQTAEGSTAILSGRSKRREPFTASELHLENLDEFPRAG